MASLAEINQTLLEQNKSLKSTSEGVKNLSTSLVPFIKKQKGNVLDNLEDRREAKASTTFLSAAGGAIKTGGERAAKGIRDFKLPQLPPLSTLLNPLALGALATTFISKFAGKLLKGGLLAFFAEDIANYILGPEASKELKDQLTRAFTFAGVGSIFGLRFGFLGALIGFFVEDPEGVLKKAGEILKSDGLQKFRKAVQLFFVNGMQAVLDFATTLKEKGITQATFDVFRNDNTLAFFGTLAAIGTTLATLVLGPKGLLFLPGLFFWTGKGIIDLFKFLNKMGNNLRGKLGLDDVVDDVPGSKKQRPQNDNKPRSKSGGKFNNLFRVVRSGASAGALVATSAATAAFPFLAAGATIVAGGYLAGLAASSAEGYFTKDLTLEQKEERARTASIESISGLPPGYSDTSAAVQRQLALKLQELEDFKSGKKRRSIFNPFRTQEDVEYDIARIQNNIRISRLSKRQQALQEAITVQNEGRLSGGGQMMAMVGSNNDQSVTTLVQQNQQTIHHLRTGDPLNAAGNQ
jgi:hypothetical protein